MYEEQNATFMKSVATAPNQDLRWKDCAAVCRRLLRPVNIHSESRW